MKHDLTIKKADALRGYANQAALARALGVTRQAINKIPDDGSLSERLTGRFRLLIKPANADQANPTANHKAS